MPVLGTASNGESGNPHWQTKLRMKNGIQIFPVIKQKLQMKFACEFCNLVLYTSRTRLPRVQLNVSQKVDGQRYNLSILCQLTGCILIVSEVY